MTLNITKNQKILSILIVCAIVGLLAIVYILSQMPVRNYDYFHNDLEGDVENFMNGFPQDENIDILFVQSHAESDFIILEMKVAGAIDNTSRYHLITVVRDVDFDSEEGYIYDFVYMNGTVEHYNYEFSISNDSLTIFLPKSHFQHNEFMVGLEGYTDGPDGFDSCRESTERFNPITYGLLIPISGIIIVTVITLIGKYKIYSLFFILSSRLKHETIPDQFVRRQIYGLIRARPGIHYTGIKDILNVGNGTLAYHLAVLEKEEFIKSIRSNNAKQFYPTELPFHMNELAQRYPKGEEVEGIRYSDIQEKIISLIKGKPGISQTEIVGELKLPKQTVSYNVKKLVQYGTIHIENDGNKNKCYLTEGTISGK